MRGFALICGVAIHASLSFVPGQPVWLIVDAERDVALSVLFFVFHVFRMTTFFMIAGFFGRLLLERRGATGFVRDRLARVAAPLVVFWCLLFPVMLLLVRWASGVAGGRLPTITTPGSGGYLLHLWFLWMLLLFYAAALVVRAGARSMRIGWVDRLVRWLVRQPLPLVPALPTFAAFMLTPEWLGWFGVPTPEGSLLPNASAVVSYGTAFAFGWLLQRQPEQSRAWGRNWPVHLTVAVATVTACLMMLGPVPVDAPEPDLLRKLACAACYAVAMWSLSFAVIGLAVRFASGRSAWRRYLADASYWIYLLHLPLVMALQVLISHVRWPALLKYGLVLGGALAVLLVSYQLLVRGTWIGAWLNGRRRGGTESGQSEAETARVA